MQSSQQILELRALLIAKSVRYGSFKLASGQTSDVYVDAKLTTCSPEAMPLVGQVFLKKIADSHWSPKAFGGLTLGADPIAFAVARESLHSPALVQCFVVRKEPKKHGLMKYIEGIEQSKDLDVVILDDVCTTGDSTIKALRYARESGMNVLGAVCLVDREAGAGDNLLREGCALESVFTLSELRALVQPQAMAAV